MRVETCSVSRVDGPEAPSKAQEEVISPLMSEHGTLAASREEKPRFYYPELDSLRFFAFLLVFFHHAPVINFPPFPFIQIHGGLGVDLFFSLSAFLFVKILGKEFERTGTINIPKFYIRRGLRIWPIYFLFCLFLVIQASVTQPLSLHPWRVVGLFTFTDNIFAAIKGYNPIWFSGHLWTISYEEQFYLVIPIMLLFFFTSQRSRAVLLLSTLAVLFTIVRTVLINSPDPTLWVLPVTHFESILLGIVVGLGGYHKLFSKVPAFLMLIFALAAGLAVCLLKWDQTYSLTVLGICTSLVVYFVYRTGKTFWTKWLSFAPLVYLGKISYGLYLYHILGIFLGYVLVKKLPILARILHSGNVAGIIASLCITIAGAIVSYQLIEKPFLKYKKRFEVVATRPA